MEKNQKGSTAAKPEERRAPYGIMAIIIVVIIIAAAGYYVLAGRGAGTSQHDAFAKCLSQKGFILYGSMYCTHCAAQKEMFGSSVQYLTYVECTSAAEQCQGAGVTAYPTWIGPDGKQHVGTQALTDLAAISGCTLTG